MYRLSNPGFYKADDSILLIQVCGAVLIVSIIAVIITGLIIATDLPSALKQGGVKASNYTRNLLTFFVVTVFIAVGAYIFQLNESKQINEARAVHTEAVITWLSDDYGIKFKADNVEALLEGTSFTVKYAGELISVNIQPGLGDELSLVDQQRAVIPPNK